MDKEYTVLEIIDKIENITQREISKRTNLSLGSVNILLNKMAHDGLIKIKQIPVNRVAYMLTPKGMAEKVNKTYAYIRANYNYITETKEKMKDGLGKIKYKYKAVAIFVDGDEISELARSAAAEVKGIEIVTDQDKLPAGKAIVTISKDIEGTLSDKGFKLINLFEWI